MERDLFRRCVKRVRHFLAPHWNGGKGALRKFVRKLLAPFRDSPHILCDLIRTPVKILAMTGITLSLSQTPALTLSPTDMPAAQRAAKATSVLDEARASADSSSVWNLVSEFTTGNQGKAIAFIDRGVTAPDELAKVAPVGADVHFIEADRSGIAQITEVLAGYRSVGAVHLLSHGGPGYLKLGSDVVTRDILSYHAQELRSWGGCLTRKADLLVYGCEVAGSPDGRAFLAEMGELTGADVAGSDDLTGSARKGGDWDLEYLRGPVETVSLSPRSSEPYEGVLADYKVTNTNNSGVGSLRQAIQEANKNSGADTITFDAGLNYDTIDVSSDLPDITEDLTITGPGAGKLTIDGNYYQVFAAYGAGTVSISGLTIEYGKNIGPFGGGGIANYAGNMTVTDCRVYNCSGFYAGAIANTGGGTLTVDDCTLFNNYASKGGGGIATPYSDLTVTNTMIYGNTGRNAGAIGSKQGGLMTITNCYIGYNQGYRASGGILRGNGDVTISDSHIYGNTGYRSGGLRAQNGGTATISNTKFFYNTAREYGGAISVFGGSEVILSDSILYGNAASAKGKGKREGGGLFVSFASADIKSSTLSYNTADVGGGIYCDYSTMSITGSTIGWHSLYPYGNYASKRGGGICIDNSTVTIDSSSVDSNTAYRHGGGIYHNGYGTLTLTGSTVSGNSTDNDGGGIYNYGYGMLTLTGCTVSSNTADDEGGGICNTYYSILTVTDSTIADNTANVYGGGLYNNRSAATLTGSTVSGNTAQYGGGIYNDGEYYDLRITNSTLSDNSAAYLGGGILHDDGLLFIRNSTIAFNTAGTSGPGYAGGGIYIEYAPVPAPPAVRAVARVATADIESTIIAGNVDSAAAPDISDVDDVIAARYSLIQDPSGHSITNGVDNNLVGVDPQLQPLADNGGPTMTHEIPLTSPAINTGSNPLALATDQRGEARESRGATDIGAYERQNMLPVIVSAVADPNPTQVGQTITFTGDATDADNDTLTYTWDFGDGGTATGVSATHAYAALGTYTVTLTVRDGFGTVSTTLTVIVEQAESLAGVGPDTDGDGFSDSLETFVGSDPNSPGSTPMNLTALGTPELTLVKGLRVILNMKPGVVGKDKIRFVGWLPIPDGTVLTGQEVVLDISGVQKRFTLDSRGRGKDGNTLITVGRPKLGFAVVKVIRKFQGDYKDEMLQWSGLDNADVNREIRTVRATILFNGRSHVTNLTVTYKAKQNKKGVAWKWIKQRP